MLIKRFIITIATVAFLLAGVGATGLVADALGMSFTPQAHACSGDGTSGGGC